MSEEFGTGQPLTPYAPGDVVGLRVWTVQLRSATWAVDCAGEVVQQPERYALKSVYRDYYWRPDENVALCLKVPGSKAPSLPRIHTEDCRENHHHNEKEPMRQDTCYRDHYPDRIDPGHSCGFYAYTSTEENKYLTASSVQIEGAVSGYGLCTIGRRGFRASKARVLAFVRPSPNAAPPAGRVSRAVWERFDPERLAWLFGVRLFETREALVEAIPLGIRTASWS